MSNFTHPLELSFAAFCVHAGRDFAYGLRLAAVSTLCFAASGSGMPAYAHEAPAGWQYPYSCCSGFDCREVSSKVIGEGPEGYLIKGTGEIVSYSDARLKNSPDGEYHWCSVAGADDTRTICLFVPPHSF
jgi:hypothetical protein